MIPNRFIQLDKIPLSSNGKIDRKALNRYKDFMESEIVYEQASSETERLLIQLYEMILGRESVSVTESFFMLGGHSLKAMLLIGRIRDVFSVEIC